MQRWKTMFSRERCLYIFFWKLQAFRKCFNRYLLFESMWIITRSNFFVIFFSLFSLCFRAGTMLTLPPLDTLSDETNHAGGGRGPVISCSGWKCSLFLDTLFRSKHHTKPIFLSWLTPPLTLSSSSQASSTQHKPWKQRKLLSLVLERKKSIFVCFLLSIQEARVPWGEKLYKQEHWD